MARGAEGRLLQGFVPLALGTASFPSGDSLMADIGLSSRLFPGGSVWVPPFPSPPDVPFAASVHADIHLHRSILHPAPSSGVQQPPQEQWEMHCVQLGN